MTITADLAKGCLEVDGARFAVSCRVRALRDGTRRSDEVTRAIPGGVPYDPRPFPKGKWRITGIERQKDKKFDPAVYGPVKIRTDAWQEVKAWELDGDGDYLRETERAVRDEGYLLHYSESRTTLGCIRLASPEDAETIAAVIEKVLATEPVYIEAT